MAEGASNGCCGYDTLQFCPAFSYMKINPSNLSPVVYLVFVIEVCSGVSSHLYWCFLTNKG